MEIDQKPKTPVTFSILVPTMGRPSLNETLRSIMEQPLMPGDEVLVIGDMNHGEAPGKDIAEKFGPQVIYSACAGAKNAWGGPQRNLGLTLAKGTWISYMDDDDKMAPNTLEIMRELCSNHPEKPILTRMMLARRQGAGGNGRWSMLVGAK